MTFDEWYATQDKSVFRTGAEHMRTAFAAGAEQMRERAAQVGDVARPRVAARPRKQLLTAEEGYDAAMVDYSDDIKNLPVGESSRAPEGSK